MSDNGAWEYGWLPDLSDPASSFTMDNIVSLTWAGIDGFSGHYSDTGNAIVLGNLTESPATIVAGSVSVPVGVLVSVPVGVLVSGPVGVLVSGPSGTDGTQFGTLRFIALASGVYNITGTFEGLDVDKTTTDVHVLQISASDGTSLSLFAGNVDGYYGGDAGTPTGPTPVVTFAFDAVGLDAGDSLFFPIGNGGDGYYNDTTGLEVQVTLNVAISTQVSTYTYDGDGLRRSAQEAGAPVPTTFIWDGPDYLMEKN